MAGIFGAANVADTCVYDSQSAIINIGGVSGVIASELRANIQRSINRIYSMTDKRAYFVIGATQGQGTIGCVFGPCGTVSNPYSSLVTGQSACKGFPITFSASGDACGGGGWTRTLVGCILGSFNMQVQAQDMLINEEVGFNFNDLELS